MKRSERISKLVERASELQSEVYDHLDFDEQDALDELNQSIAASVRSIDNLVGFLYEELSTLKRKLGEDFSDTGEPVYDKEKDHHEAKSVYGYWAMQTIRCPYPSPEEGD